MLNSSHEPGHILQLYEYLDLSVKEGAREPSAAEGDCLPSRTLFLHYLNDLRYFNELASDVRKFRQMAECPGIRTPGRDVPVFHRVVHD